MTRLHLWPARASSAVNTLSAQRAGAAPDHPLDYQLDPETFAPEHARGRAKETP